MNVLAELRKQCHTTQSDFADTYGFSRTYVGFVESGQVDNLTQRYVLAIIKLCDDKGVPHPGMMRMIEEYEKSQFTERVLEAYRFQRPLLWSPDEMVSPFEHYLMDTCGSKQRFCKLLKVPTAAVSNYAQGKQKSMPGVIRSALLNVNFRHINELEMLQDQWYETRIAE